MQHYVFSINGFEFGGLENLNKYMRGENQWVFTPQMVSGFSGVQVRHSERNSFGKHGIQDYNSFLAKRVMTFTGTLKARNMEAMEEAIDLIASKVTLPAVYTPEQDGYMRMDFWNPLLENPVKYWCMVKVQNMPKFERTFRVDKKRLLTFSMKAESSFFYSPEKTSAAVKKTFIRSGVRLPLSPSSYGTNLPLKFSPQSVFRKDILNEGNFAVHPKITINGPTKNPAIRHVGLDIEMRFSLDLAEGEYIVIDTSPKKHTIVNQNGENFRKYFDKNSRWLYLLPALNQIDFFDDLDGAEETGEMPEEQVFFDFYTSSVAKA